MQAHRIYLRQLAGLAIACHDYLLAVHPNLLCLVPHAGRGVSSFQYDQVAGTGVAQQTFFSQEPEGLLQSHYLQVHVELGTLPAIIGINIKDAKHITLLGSYPVQYRTIRPHHAFLTTLATLIGELPPAAFVPKRQLGTYAAQQVLPALRAKFPAFLGVRDTIPIPDSPTPKPMAGVCIGL